MTKINAVRTGKEKIWVKLDDVMYLTTDTSDVTIILTLGAAHELVRLIACAMRDKRYKEDSDEVEKEGKEVGDEASGLRQDDGEGKTPGVSQTRLIEEVVKEVLHEAQEGAGGTGGT